MLNQIRYRVSRGHLVAIGVGLMLLASGAMGYAISRFPTLVTSTGTAAAPASLPSAGTGESARAARQSIAAHPSEPSAGVPAGLPGSALTAAIPRGGVINLGAVITESGLGDETPVYRGLDAAIKEVDAAGGVDGSKLQLEVLDDGTDPNRGQAALRRLVESDHVFALAGECAPLTDINAGPYIEQQQIPTFGSCFASGAEYRNPFFFPIVVEPFLEGRLDASFLTTQMGVQHPALVSLDVNVLAETHDGVLSQLQDEHVGICDAAKVPIEQALYDSVVLNEIQKGCDGVVLNLDPPRILDYLQAAQRYGYHPRMIGKTAFDQSVAQNGGSEAEGLVTYFAQLMPAVETQSAAVQHFAQVMHRYHPEEHDLNLALVGYLAGSGIAGELSRIEGPITRAALLQAIYSRPLDLGLAPPAHWTKTDHLAETSCRFYQLHQGAFQPDSGWYHL